MALQSEFAEYGKLALYAFFPALVVALLFGFLSNMLAQLAWINYFILALLGMWAVAKIPKEIDSFWGIIILVLFLLGIQGVLGWLLPSVSALQWVNVSTVTGLFTSLVAAAVGVSFISKYVK